jgi:inosose dehydratase
MLLDRVAGAPISWGVCEVPGWGHQLDPARVLSEMRAVGLVATEFGPEGFLPDDPAAKAEVLAGHGLSAVGGFVPVVLHDTDRDPMSAVACALDAFTAANATTLVLAADTGATGYDHRVELTAPQWRLLLATLDRIHEVAGERGITATLHPHVGTIVERPDDVARVLDGCAIPLCLDTGHLMIGGGDPAALAAEVPDRIAHTHLKDVDADLAARVRAGEIAYSTAVAEGMYRPLGQGDADIAAIIATLRSSGYTGWYVLEQDTVLTAEPPVGGGPIDDVRASLRFISDIATTAETAGTSP